MTGSKFERFSVDFPLLGKRQYVHSTSISNFWAEREPDADGYELVLKHWIHNRIVFTPLKSGTMPAAVGHVAITKGGERQLWEISEDVAHPVTTRGEYDEAMAPVDVDWAAQTCEVGIAEGFSFYDRLIPGNKALINQCLQPGVTLVAAKIITKGFPCPDTKLTLRLKGHVGKRVFKTAILVDNAVTGEIIYYGQ